LRLLADDLRRLLVRAQALERRVPQSTVVAPLGERDLGDELGLDPVRALGLEAAWGIHERGLILLERQQKLVELREGLIVETGADLSGIAQLAVLIDAEQQGAESLARALRIGEAADHHLLPARAFRLDPVARPEPVAIGRLGAFRDHAFEPQLAGLPEVVVAVSQKLRPDANGTHTVADHRTQHRFAVGQRGTAQVVAVEVENVEREERQRRLRAAERVLQRLEAGAPRCVQHDDLPSIHAARTGSLARSLATSANAAVQSLPLRETSRALPLSMRQSIR
jgi:hypothetical protein